MQPPPASEQRDELPAAPFDHLIGAAEAER
jgi:hypothetical protein